MMRISAGSSARAAALAVAALGLWSCTVSVEEPRPPRPEPGPRICTREYDPVCGERRGDFQTFANSCLARSDGYRVVARGQCRGGRPDWPDRPGRPHKPDRPGKPFPDEDVKFCTREYRPVCGEKFGNHRTFGNACEARAADYRIVGNGPC